MPHWRQLLLEARRCLELGRAGEALQFCDRAALESEDARYTAALVRGAVLLELGDPNGALSCYEAISDINQPDPDLDCARGLALFELGQLPEAEAALKSAIHGDPSLAQGHYTLGLLYEISGSPDAARCFREARRLAPELYAPDCQYTRPQFEALLKEAAAGLPPRIVKALESYPIVVAELPMVDELRQLRPRMSPQSLALVLGAEGAKSGADKPCLLIFKRNVERAFRDRDTAPLRVRETVIREFSLALGFSDDDLDG